MRCERSGRVDQTPVTQTIKSGRGIPGGTIATRSFRIGAKCEIEVNTNTVASPYSAQVSKP
jgi:hypothetical protein